MKTTESGPQRAREVPPSPSHARVVAGCAAGPRAGRLLGSLLEGGDGVEDAGEGREERAHAHVESRVRNLGVLLRRLGVELGRHDRFAGLLHYPQQIIRRTQSVKMLRALGQLLYSTQRKSTSTSPLMNIIGGQNLNTTFLRPFWPPLSVLELRGRLRQTTTVSKPKLISLRTKHMPGASLARGQP